MNIKENQDKFIEIYKRTIKREGADKLLDYLLSTDFFTAPASGKNHLAEQGGLCQHSMNVYYRLLKEVQDEYGADWQKVYSEETVAICALLHDVCKVNFYKEDSKNVKINGVWEQVPYYTIEDQLPYGHGEKSVYIINGFMRITREEAMAINWHMGSFDARVVGGNQFGMKAAYTQYPIAFMLHIADMKAAYLDEKQKTEV